MIFCDEPTSGLDSYMARNVVQVSFQTTIVWLHNLSFFCRSWKTLRSRARRWFVRSISRRPKYFLFSIEFFSWPKVGRPSSAQLVMPYPFSPTRVCLAHPITILRNSTFKIWPLCRAKSWNPRKRGKEFAMPTMLHKRVNVWLKLSKPTDCQVRPISW